MAVNVEKIDTVNFIFNFLIFIAEIHMVPIVVEAASSKSSDYEKKLGQCIYN